MSKLDIPKELTCNRCKKALIGLKSEQDEHTFCIKCMTEICEEIDKIAIEGIPQEEESNVHHSI